MMSSYLQTRWRNQKRQPGATFISLIGLVALLSGLVSHLVYAVPMMTTYQGHLADASGNPLNATVSMTFALYDSPTGGTPLWTETHPAVTVTQGVFSVVLGSIVSFDNDDMDGERYLGVTVESDAEMTPREQLGSTAFAMIAGVAESVVDDAVSTSKLAESAVTTDKVANNTVTTVKIADGAVTGAKIADLAGHSATELDDITSAGSGEIITTDERDRWNSLKNGAFQLNGNNAYYTDGNVGIGTTTPNAKLDVVNENGPGTFVSVGGNMPKDDETQGLIGYEWKNLNRGDEWRFYLADPDGGFGVIPGSLEIWEYPSDGGDCCRPRLRIESSYGLSLPEQVMINKYGNLGIGTTSPKAKLDVNGNAVLRSRLQIGSAHTTWFNQAITGFSESTASSDAFLLVPGYTSTENSDLRLYVLDNIEDRFSIWGNSCAGGSCGDINKASLRHFFTARGDAYHAGNVGIGTTSPQYKLDVAGTIRGNNVSPSDLRLKQNIQPLEDSLAKVEQLRGVRFEWKDAKPDTGTQIGVIAQEVETVLPELVSTDDDGYKSVAYGQLTAVLVEAVKELKTENTALKAETQALRAETQALKAIICEDHPEKAICQ